MARSDGSSAWVIQLVSAIVAKRGLIKLPRLYRQTRVFAQKEVALLDSTCIVLPS
jgi:hypothetical protein